MNKANKALMWSGYYLALFLLVVLLKVAVREISVNEMSTETENVVSLMEEAFSHIESVDYVETETGTKTVVYDDAGNEYVIDLRDAADETESKVQIFRTDTPDNLVEMQEYIENNTAGDIVVEISKGTVTGENGDGETDSGYYIHYSGNYEVNDRVESVFIYNPTTQYIDDVLYRQDTKIVSE